VNNALCGCNTPCNPPTASPTRTPTPTVPEATPTPTPPAVGQILFQEHWERAALRRQAPDTWFSADSGDWVVGDTVSNFPECGPSPQFAEIVNWDGSRALLLHSEPTGSCADNIFVYPIVRNPPGLKDLNIAVTNDLFISFRETGVLDGLDPCDAVFVDADFDLATRVTYVLQRGPYWKNNSSHCSSLLSTSHPLLISPEGGAYVRNVVADAAALGLNTPLRLRQVSFSVDANGEATFDDLVIFRAKSPGVTPSARPTPPQPTATATRTPTQPSGSCARVRQGTWCLKLVDAALELEGVMEQSGCTLSFDRDLSGPLRGNIWEVSAADPNAALALRCVFVGDPATSCSGSVTVRRGTGASQTSALEGGFGACPE
jgi:hypothetical protein